jgi:hypothetical protein
MSVIPLKVPSQRFKELGGKRTADYFGEGLIPALRAPMDVQCYRPFAGAALAHDEERKIRCRNVSDYLFK